MEGSGIKGDVLIRFLGTVHGFCRESLPDRPGRGKIESDLEDCRDAGIVNLTGKRLSDQIKWVFFDKGDKLPFPLVLKEFNEVRDSLLSNVSTPPDVKERIARYQAPPRNDIRPAAIATIIKIGANPAKDADSAKRARTLPGNVYSYIGAYLQWIGRKRSLCKYMTANKSKILQFLQLCVDNKLFLLDESLDDSFDLLITTFNSGDYKFGRAKALEELYDAEIIGVDQCAPLNGAINNKRSKSVQTSSDDEKTPDKSPELQPVASVNTHSTPVVEAPSKQADIFPDVPSTPVRHETEFILDEIPPFSNGDAVIEAINFDFVDTDCDSRLKADHERAAVFVKSRGSYPCPEPLHAEEPEIRVVRRDPPVPILSPDQEIRVVRRDPPVLIPDLSGALIVYSYPLDHLSSYCGEETDDLNSEWYVERRSPVRGLFYQDSSFTVGNRAIREMITPRQTVDLNPTRVRLLTVDSIGPYGRYEAGIMSKMKSATQSYFCGPTGMVVKYSTVYDGVIHGRAQMHIWSVELDGDSTKKGIPLTAACAQQLLEHYSDEEHTGLIMIPTVYDGQRLARWIKPFRGGVFDRPGPRFPGFISALTDRQRQHFEHTFSNSVPACAALGGCLHRKGFLQAERDPRLWRTIHVCMGAKSCGQVRDPDFNQRPSVVDNPDMTKIFDQIYEALKEFGQRYNPHFSIKHRSSFQLSLFETLIPHHSGETRIIGLAVMVSRMTALSTIQQVPALVLEHLSKIRELMHSDYFIPRLIRVFDGDLLPDLNEMRHAKHMPLDYGNSKNYAWIYCDNQYHCMDSPGKVDLTGNNFASLWSSSLGASNNIILGGDHSVQYGLLCSMSTSDRDLCKTPRFWWHKACIDAKNNVDERVAKHGPMINQTARFDCDCCGKVMELVELDPSGKFKNGTKCAGQYPVNMFDFAGHIDIVGGAGNYVARYTLPVDPNIPDRLFASGTVINGENPGLAKAVPAEFRAFQEYERTK